MDPIHQEHEEKPLRHDRQPIDHSDWYEDKRHGIDVVSELTKCEHKRMPYGNQCSECRAKLPQQKPSEWIRERSGSLMEQNPNASMQRMFEQAILDYLDSHAQ